MSTGTSNPQSALPNLDQPVRQGGAGGKLLVPWQRGMDKGSGYDTVSRAVLSSAASLPAAKLGSHVVLENLGQFVEKKVVQIESIERLRDIVQLGSSLDVGYDAFSANHVGKFLKESRIDEYNLYFLVLCYVENTDVAVDGFALNPAYDDAYYDGAAFRKGFGDYFVSGYVKGGYLIGLCEIKARSKQDLIKLKQEVGAGYSDGTFSANGKFAAAWEKFESRTDLDKSIQVIHAGMGGYTFKTVANSVLNASPQPGTGGGPPVPGAGTPSVRPIDVEPPKPKPRDVPSTLPIEEITDKDIKVVDEDDDEEYDEDEGDEDEYLSPEASQAYLLTVKDLPITKKPDSVKPATASPSPAPTPRGGNTGNGSGPPAGTTSGGTTEILLNPELTQIDVLPYKAVELTMQGLLDAADELPKQALVNGVALYAVLESYFPLFRKSGVGEPVISRLDYDRKRELLNKCYMKAKFIWNSVSYALERGSQFAVPEDELKAIRTRMETLMRECSSADDNLRRDPTFVLPAVIQPPPDSDIPAWAVERASFSPFKVQPNPVLFFKLLMEAADVAVARPNPGAKKELAGYLSAVLEKSVENYGNAKDALNGLASTFPALDLEPKERTTILEDLAANAGQSFERWKSTRAQLKASYDALEGKSGLDQKALDFLKFLNPPLFGADEDAGQQQYGFYAFWEALHKSLKELAQQSRQWSTKTKFRDVIDYGSDRLWSDRAKEFETQAAAIDSKVRFKLMA